MSRAGFWSSETLKTRLPSEAIVQPYNEEAIKACCYELSVGEEAFVSGEDAQKIHLKNGGTVAIPPGQVVLVLTQETLKMPLDAIGLLSIKFGLKARGLINVSGFHVDPGFEGKLVFSMYNAGVQTIHLGVGSRIFMLWLCSIDDATADKYHGTHNQQKHLPDDAITNLAARMPSPFTVEEEIKSLRHEMNIIKTILGVAVTLGLTAFFTSLKGCATSSPSPPPFFSPLSTSPMLSASGTPSNSPNAPSATDAAISPSVTPLPSATVQPSGTHRP
ncbi:MAG: hypothetical protein DLM73_00190 [Chthoniobacterales bacterium]|nr:MAG: hypothetical protein DLM73_00190 [Chthoniobacterales bacterium]